MQRRDFLKAGAATVGLLGLSSSARAAGLSQDQQARVERVLGGLDLRARVSQMMMSYPPLDKTAPVDIGSVIFLGNLLKSEEKVVERVRSLQSRATVPLFIAADVEGGQLNKLSFLPGLEEVPSNLAVSVQGEAGALETGVRVGEGMKRLGLNMALAPVLDVAGSGMMFDSERSFGKDPATAARLGSAYSRGLSQSGVVAIGKHWPGYGALSENTDHHFVVTQRQKAEVERQAQAFIDCDQQLAGVMLANVGFDSYGSRPAILSSELVEWAHAYGWLTITDDLAIDALSEATGGDKEEVVRQAFLAGNDVLLTTAPIDWDQALDYRGILLEVVAGRPELEGRVAESVRRILSVKAGMGLL